ncbi:MAG: DNA (cytosine-5-)-methyltransferase [Mycoplasmataceae bacterium]|nr:DNA (cytosine-5-)-methyltransferase [Mycoplasmataceae bacterium]
MKNYSFSRDGKIPLKSLNTVTLNRLFALSIAIKLTNNLVDIKTVKGENINQVDLITYSFPCQDLSLQGKGKGIYNGKSSSLLWEVKRIIQELSDLKTLPRFLLLENVSALFSSKHSLALREWKDFLSNLGYVNHCFILNAKHFDVPQNRSRAFIVSELNQNNFNINNLLKNNQLTNKTIKDIYEPHYNHLENEFILKKGSILDFNPKPNPKSGIALTKIINYTNFSSEARAISINGIAPTITAMGASSRIKIIIDINKKQTLRLLKPLELWKLMGFTKEDFFLANQFNLVPENNLIKQAGNSIVVDVLEAIFAELFQ